MPRVHADEDRIGRCCATSSATPSSSPTRERSSSPRALSPGTMKAPTAGAGSLIEVTRVGHGNRRSGGVQGNDIRSLPAGRRGRYAFLSRHGPGACHSEADHGAARRHDQAWHPGKTAARVFSFTLPASTDARARRTGRRSSSKAWMMRPAPDAMPDRAAPSEDMDEDRL